MEPKKKDKKPFIICMSLVFLLICYFSLHLGRAMTPQEITTTGNHISIGVTNNSQSSNNFLEAATIAIDKMSSDPLGFLPIAPISFTYIGVFTVIFGLMIAYSVFRKEATSQTMNKDQNGSSKWNDDIKGYNSRFTTEWKNKLEVPDPNIILSKNVKLGMKIKSVDDQRNLNCVIIGGSGTGKSFREIKPNIMQKNSSVIVTDPSGELLECCGKPLMDSGVRVKVFSTSDMVHSNCYNPFDYVYDENGNVDETKVSTMIYLFLKNANGAKEKSGDPFWEKSAKALLSAIAYYLLESKTVEKDQINFNTVLKMIQAGKVNEESSSSKSPLDKIMEEEEKAAKQEGRISKAVSNYKTFKLATGKTANSILITCAVDLQLFDTESVKNLTKTDIEEDSNNLHLENIGNEQTALFINIPQANGTYNFLVAMMYSQMFDALYTKGEKINKHKWMIKNKYGIPLFTFLDNEESAKQLLSDLADAEVHKRITKRGAEFYQIKIGKKVIREVMSEKYAYKILNEINEAYVEKHNKEQLPFHIRCLMDEWANIGEVPEFPEKLATMRKYNISCTIVLQNIAQVKKKYDKEWEGIMGNCDSLVFLGSKENETCKYIADMLGKATIIIKNTGRSLSSKGGNSSQNYNHSARDLMDAAEVARMPGNKCIVIIRGLFPFYDEKYNFLEHPEFKSTGDANPNNKFGLDILDTYFNNSPLKKNPLAKKTKNMKNKIQQTLVVEEKEIKTKQDLLETVGSKTEVEFLERVSSTPHTSIPKTNTVIKTKPVSSGVKPTDESEVFFFG